MVRRIPFLPVGRASRLLDFQQIHEISLSQSFGNFSGITDQV